MGNGSTIRHLYETIPPKGQEGEGGAQRGTCLLMCPESERLRREERGQLSVFEVNHSSTSGARRYRTSVSLAVKEYVRSGAGQDVPHPQDLRPPPTLKNTIDYLIRDVTSRTDYPWHVVYDFVDNRIRSIRQDITYQQLAGVEILYTYALASRFYLYSCYRLSAVSVEKFDPKLNGDQLQQCLLKLLKMDATVEPTLDLELPFLEEFESYFLLANLGSTEAIMHTLELPKEARQHPKVRLALAISLHFLDNNFIRFFRLTRQLSPLGKCAVLPHVTTIRRQALSTMSAAYSSMNAQFPLRLLGEWLAFNSLKDTVEFTSAYGIQISGENVLFRRGTFRVPAEEPRIRFLIPELDRDSPSNFIFGL